MQLTDLGTSRSNGVHGKLGRSWGDVEQTEWMYGMPTREEDNELWAGEWADYMLEWTKHKKVHILSLATFISEPPFKDLRNKVDSFPNFNF